MHFYYHKALLLIHFDRYSSDSNPFNWRFLPVINHSKLVNERVYTDIVFVVETKQIKAHKSIIQARCPNLVKKSVKKLTEGKGFKRIDLNEKDHITEDALTRVLVYLYSGQVDWSTISQIQVVHLINAAVVYELERLAQLCERYLQEHLTLDEAYTLLKESHDLNIERAKKIVFYYALDHYTQFIANARAKELGIDLFQEVRLDWKNQVARPNAFCFPVVN